MLVLGISGGLDPVHDNASGVVAGQFHDSAAALVRDGTVVAAFEEERFNRIKHTNKFPINAISACLAAAGGGIEKMDAVAYYSSEEAVSARMHLWSLGRRPMSAMLGLKAEGNDDATGLFRSVLKRDIGCAPARERIHFIKHHVAHAESAYAISGLDQALVVTLDGQGDRESGSVALGNDGHLEFLRVLPVEASVGLFYLAMTRYLGLGSFGEYKLMGLAPHGNPLAYREVFDEFCRLLPDGVFELQPGIELALRLVVKPRLPAEPFLPEHADFAAATQRVAERAVFHLLHHFQRATGMKNLCLAGGVGHNCTINGKLLAAGMFSQVFVQPAAHDAGCAMGSALAASKNLGERVNRLSHVYLGTDIGSSSVVEAELAKWGDLLEWRTSGCIEREAAELLASGAVCGWVQGRSEFGPRALGNRSILADPRDPQNRSRINKIVKKREEFRPFAPAVLAEFAASYFDIPECRADLSHMTYVLNVRPDKRNVLGAVTHVDGSARVQTVSRQMNGPFWSLIDCFRQITSVPVLLNTSFNNNVEPIVDSVADAIVTFLTTDLDFLVVGQFMIRKRPLTLATCQALRVSLPAHAWLRRSRMRNDEGSWETSFALGNSYNGESLQLSRSIYSVLEVCDGDRTWRELAEDVGVDPVTLLPQLLDLWARRGIVLRP